MAEPGPEPSDPDMPGDATLNKVTATASSPRGLEAEPEAAALETAGSASSRHQSRQARPPRVGREPPHILYPRRVREADAQDDAKVAAMAAAGAAAAAEAAAKEAQRAAAAAARDHAMAWHTAMADRRTAGPSLCAAAACGLGLKRCVLADVAEAKAEQERLQESHANEISSRVQLATVRIVKADGKLEVTRVPHCSGPELAPMMMSPRSGCAQSLSSTRSCRTETVSCYCMDSALVSRLRGLIFSAGDCCPVLRCCRTPSFAGPPATQR